MTFQVLTKRPDRMAAYFNTPNRRRMIAEQVMPLSNMLASAAGTHTKRLKMDDFEAAFLAPGPLKNIWLGASVENQAAADERVPHLLATPAAVRFLSCEPLLGEVNFEEVPVGMFGPLRPHGGASPTTPRINWVIVGGESGHGARTLRVEWVRSLVEQCKAAGTACFVKQLGARVDGEWKSSPLPMLAQNNRHWLLKDNKGGDITEFPADLRVREFPQGATT